ncbi:MAG: restriction endonuclease [Dolichospermum sp.]|uniref:Uncharacterized protein n=2 Tax=Sphaerospermopsis TaxID=752201 RepID=A0A480A8Z9_9CYAN|nr:MULTISPECIES: restriction endonuclease [Sphaerospermopsis]MDB9443783.1 restriction endonuclease [Sphaerospermopsis kisseleviana CS-549]BAZ82675.1 hypothetical protein NIES73_39580 [Sphaerospermopsis kisseleviana NIES-73]GCL39728.1 hypothetical protein SR1949_48560 [Sphaerospermopsis reniformis]
MPLHIKASSQANKKGEPIFDPVGTNLYITNYLNKSGWNVLPIPNQYKFFGKEIDLAKAGLVIENQFSNYPFLLNNTARVEFLFQKQILLAGNPIKLIVIITKSQVFPSANSSLYYEQAVKQLLALDEIALFKIPIRVVGLFENTNTITSAIWTEYGKTTARNIVTQYQRQYQIIPGRKNNQYIFQLI